MNLLIEEMESKDLKQDVFNRLVVFEDHVGMNLNAFSARIGMEQSTLHYQFHGKRALSLDTIINTLSAYDDLSADRRPGCIFGDDGFGSTASPCYRRIAGADRSAGNL